MPHECVRLSAQKKVLIQFMSITNSLLSFETEENNFDTCKKVG